MGYYDIISKDIFIMEDFIMKHIKTINKPNIKNSLGKNMIIYSKWEGIIEMRVELAKAVEEISILLDQKRI